MPGFDGTGPQGLGPNTGLGQGPCNKNVQNQPGFGRGMRCQGFGRRFQNASNAPLSLEEQEKLLEKQLEAIRQQKKDLKK